MAAEHGGGDDSGGAGGASSSVGVRHAKPDPAVDSGLLATPTLFPRAPAPRPRLLPVGRRSWAFPGGSAAAESARGGAGSGAVAGVSSSLSSSSSSSTSSSAPYAASAASGLAALSAPPAPQRSAQAERLEDYLACVARTYYGAREVGAGAGADFSLLRRTTLGLLASPCREPLVMDKWAPVEVARFEAALCLVGKNFAHVAAAIGSKTTADCVEFFYAWKQTSHYQLWKDTFKAGDEKLE